MSCSSSCSWVSKTWTVCLPCWLEVGFENFQMIFLTFLTISDDMPVLFAITTRGIFKTTFWRVMILTTAIKPAGRLFFRRTDLFYWCRRHRGRRRSCRSAMCWAVVSRDIAISKVVFFVSSPSGSKRLCIFSLFTPETRRSRIICSRLPPKLQYSARCRKATKSEILSLFDGNDCWTCAFARFHWVLDWNAVYSTRKHSKQQWFDFARQLAT